MVFAYALFGLFRHVAVFRYGALISTAGGFSGYFQGELSYLLTRFASSYQGVSNEYRFQYVQVGGTLGYQDFFYRGLGLTGSMLVSFASPLAATFLGAPRSGSVLGRKGLSSVSAFVHSIMVLEFLVSGEFYGLYSGR